VVPGLEILVTPDALVTMVVPGSEILVTPDALVSILRLFPNPPMILLVMLSLSLNWAQRM
jgi:hypothetical protein